MKEKFFNIGYTTYLQKRKKNNKKWTSKIVGAIEKHKILTMCLIIIIMCVVMNCLLIYNFIRVIEQSNIF